METITITLNGREVSGQSGMTVLDLAIESGLDVPTLCHDPNLAPFGACRICIVEDERSGTLMASCVTPITPGMVINTQSQRVLERRATIVELMLASHPDSCPVCDKGNCCQLRKVASDLGVGFIKLQRIPQLAAIAEVNPFIERDLSKCILCAKCIRACEDLVCEGALDYLGRGFISKPATLGDQPLENSECTFCGTCVAMCPTGAIMEREKDYHGTSATTVHTTCPYCGCGCTIALERKGDRLVRARPDTNSQVNKGTLCVRGSYGYDFVHSSERLTEPLINVNGDFQAVSWDEALSLVADNFMRIKETNGVESLAVFGSSKCTNEENYLLQRFARCILGTNNIDNGSRLYGSGSVASWEAMGFGSNVKSISELEKSEVIIVVGTDPTSVAPQVGYAVRRAVRHKGAKLVVIDPRQTKLTFWAHLWLKPKAGTDSVLLNGITKAVIEGESFDKNHEVAKIDNFDNFAKELKSYTSENIENITGVKWKDIIQTAQLFAVANKASIVYGNGIIQQVNGTATVTALINLALLTGITDEDEGGFYKLLSENNAQGACDMGALPNYLPGYQGLDDAVIRQKFEEQWVCRLPVETGLTALEMIHAAETGSIKGMYIVGENTVSSFPNSEFVRQALGKLDFLVVQDIFLTDTARLAKVVLPAAGFAEKEGTFTNLEGRVQRVRRALNPSGNSLPDWEIILHLAKKMECSLQYSSPKDIMDEITELVPLYHGISYINLDTKGLYDGRVNYKQLFSERRRFSVVKYLPATNDEGDKFPFTLLTGSLLYHFGSGSRTSRSTRLKRFTPGAFIEINSIDAKKLAIKDGDKVKVISPVNEIITMAKVSDTVDLGTVFMPISLPANPVNSLFDIVMDEKTKTPAMNRCAVRLKKVSSDV